MRLEGKVAIITGAGSGIGRATAIRFAQEGAKVTAVDVNQESVDTVVKEIIDDGGDAIALKVDVSKKDQVDKMVSETLNKFGQIDCLVNNAGITRDSFLTKMSEDKLDAVLDVNLKGTYLCCQAVVGPMSEKKNGRIINTASIGMLGNPGQVNYAASKAGVVGLTKTLAIELARNNINVNAVCPGGTDTQMVAGIPEKVLQFILKKIPKGRLAQPEEIASAHVFLASDEADYITGHILFVDGGASAGF